MTLNEVKRIFISTGRLNRKIVRDEIAISWYKCHLNRMSPEIMSNESNLDLRDLINEKLNQTLDHFVPISFDFYLSDESLKTIAFRNEIFKFNLLSLDENYLGTNGGALALKLDTIFIVEKEEHYLEQLNKFYTIGIPFKTDNGCKFVLMLLSEIKPSEVELKNIVKNINSFFSGNEKVYLNEANRLGINGVLNLAKEVGDDLSLKINNILKSKNLILLEGDQTDILAKTAWYISSFDKDLPYHINGKILPETYQNLIIKKILEEKAPLIIDHIECLNEKALGLLTSKIDERLIQSNVDSILILTLSTKDELLLEKIKSHKIYKRMKHYQLDLKWVQMDKKSFLIELLEKLNIKYHEDQVRKTLSILKGLETHEIENKIRKYYASCNELTLEGFISLELSNLQSLEEKTIDYITRVYDQTENNATLAAEILGISRSTFYRKLEKSNMYQTSNE